MKNVSKIKKTIEDKAWQIKKAGLDLTLAKSNEELTELDDKFEAEINDMAQTLEFVTLEYMKLKEQYDEMVKVIVKEEVES